MLSFVGILYAYVIVSKIQIKLITYSSQHQRKAERKSMFAAKLIQHISDIVVGPCAELKYTNFTRIGFDPKQTV